MKIRNLGRKSLRGIVEKVHNLGWSFKDDVYKPKKEEKYSDFTHYNDRSSVLVDEDEEIIELTEEYLWYLK